MREVRQRSSETVNGLYGKGGTYGMVGEVGVLGENVAVEFLLKLTLWLEFFMIVDEMGADVAWIDNAFARDAYENLM